MATTSQQALVNQIRAEFPILGRSVRGKRLAYLDNAATTQKPQSVIDATVKFYSNQNANIHRAVHELSEISTRIYDTVRADFAGFVRAPDVDSVIYTKGCTESINLVASSWAEPNLESGDVILVSHMEHHANIVPWQVAAERKGATVVTIAITDSGKIDLEDIQFKLKEHRVRLVAVKHVCNTLGTVNPVRQIVEMAHSSGALVLVDGAQALAHEEVDLTELDADFYTFSSHKAYGPTGLGFLYGRKSLLKQMRPYQVGGDNIKIVSFEKTSFADLPNKFEPGTPNIAGIAGFAAALEFLQRIEVSNSNSAARVHEQRLLDLATEGLLEIPGVRIIGNAPKKAPVISFVCEWGHPHDVGTILDQHGVAVRTGHHCCMPLMKRMAVPATTRASFAVYNDEEDVEQLLVAVRSARNLLWN